VRALVRPESPPPIGCGIAKTEAQQGIARSGNPLAGAVDRHETRRFDKTSEIEPAGQREGWSTSPKKRGKTWRKPAAPAEERQCGRCKKKLRLTN
jgi:hypothetical protein